MKLNRANLHEYQKYGVDFIINNPISARRTRTDQRSHSLKLGRVLPAA